MWFFRYLTLKIEGYSINNLIPTFAECSEEESFSRSRGMTNGSKRGVEENADCMKED